MKLRNVSEATTRTAPQRSAEFSCSAAPHRVGPCAFLLAVTPPRDPVPEEAPAPWCEFTAPTCTLTLHAKA